MLNGNQPFQRLRREKNPRVLDYLEGGEVAKRLIGSRGPSGIWDRIGKLKPQAPGLGYRLDAVLELVAADRRIENPSSTT